jgi:hypothetical protein
MAEYIKLITLLADYNKKNPNDPFRWGGFFIIKSPKQFNDDVWKLTAESGCSLLMIGLETFVERVRFDMNKKVTNQDVEFCIEKIAKYNIPVVFLVFVGYPTETQEDIEESIKWLEDHLHVNKHFGLFFNETMFVLPGSWVEQNTEVYQIKFIDSTNALKWESPTSTLEIRQARSDLLRDTARLLGYNVASQDEDQFQPEKDRTKQHKIDPHGVIDLYLSRQIPM